MASKILIFSSAAALLLTAACKTHRQDVPVPDDPQAAAWTPVIKDSYPGWQPPETMPKGNPDYNQAFQKTDRKTSGTMNFKVDNPQPETSVPASAVVKLHPLPPPAETKKEPVPPSDIKNNVQEPDKKTAPAMVRIDVRKADQSCFLVNGEQMPDLSVRMYLLDMGKLNPEFAVKLYTEDKAPAERIQQVKDYCKNAGIESIEVFTQTEIRSAQQKAAEKLCTRLPETVEGQFTDYKVEKNDSLSRIALKQYHHAMYWPLIFKANYKKMNGNPNSLKIGMKLQIPVLKTAEPVEKTAEQEQTAVPAKPAPAVQPVEKTAEPEQTAVPAKPAPAVQPVK